MKLKRLFTAILSAALTLSLCAMPAMADSTAGTGAATTPSKTPVKTTSSKVKTGDDTSINLAGITAFVSLLGIAGTKLFKKRKIEE